MQTERQLSHVRTACINPLHYEQLSGNSFFKPQGTDLTGLLPVLSAVLADPQARGELPGECHFTQEFGTLP